MSVRWLSFGGAVVALLMAAATVPNAVADGATFSTLYEFEAPAATTFTSPLGLNQTPGQCWVRTAPFTG
jgi:hypothetical protein